jgi:hypothetical protein
MPDEHHPLTRRQADQARTDFAAIESDLEAIYARLAKAPTRGDLARAALGIIFCSAVVTTLFLKIMAHWARAGLAVCTEPGESSVCA